MRRRIGDTTLPADHVNLIDRVNNSHQNLAQSPRERLFSVAVYMRGASWPQKGQGMDPYDLLQFLHIAAAIAWVGGGTLFNVLGTQVLRARNGGELAAFALRVEWLGTRYFTPLSVLVLVFGAAMIGQSEAWSFSDAWVILGLAGMVATIVTGAGFLGPEAGRIGRAIHGGVDPVTLAPQIDRLLWISRIDLVVLFLVVADMVFKPGV